MTQTIEHSLTEREKVESWRLHVLIEAGYLSNARDAQHIDSPAYRQLLAEAVAKGLE